MVHLGKVERVCLRTVAVQHHPKLGEHGHRLADRGAAPVDRLGLAAPETDPAEVAGRCTMTPHDRTDRRALVGRVVGDSWAGHV